MFAYSFLNIASAGSPEAGDPSSLLGGVLPMVVIFAIFYFVLILPARNKQKKLDAMVSELKAGDRVIITPGIFATVVSTEGDNALQVRVDEKTKIKVLRTAVAGLQDQAPETEKR
jgi:preprotein translocase subunit YajC